MRTGRNLSYRNRAGGHNNRPVYPADTQTGYRHDRKGCLPGITVFLTLLVLAGIVASIFLFIPWWVESQTGHYSPFKNQALAGTIANVKTGESNVSKLLLTTSPDGGAIRAASPYLLHCKEWRLHADILTTPSWVNTPAHSWFQLASIEGSQCLDQHGKPQSRLDFSITGSDDSFGKNVRINGEGFGIVSAKDITSKFMPVDGKTYKVIVTPTSLLLEPTR